MFDVLTVLAALATGLCLAAIQYRHSDSLYKAMIGKPNVKEKLDATDRKLLVGAAVFLVLLFTFLSRSSLVG